MGSRLIARSNQPENPLIVIKTAETMKPATA